jgi:hypothetical protein
VPVIGLIISGRIAAAHRFGPTSLCRWKSAVGRRTSSLLKASRRRAGGGEAAGAEMNVRRFRCPRAQTSWCGCPLMFPGVREVTHSTERRNHIRSIIKVHSGQFSHVNGKGNSCAQYVDDEVPRTSDDAPEHSSRCQSYRVLDRAPEWGSE